VASTRTKPYVFPIRDRLAPVLPERQCMPCPCTLMAMCRKRILVFAVAAIISVMVGALVYEAFDIHDTKPFPIDPEIVLIMLDSLLVVCLSTVVLTVSRLASFFSLVSELLPFGLSGLMPGLWHPRQSFEVERLLFSPPLSATSLRI
jgi:hypothetical protein